MTDLKGKTVPVTGGSRGVGAAIVCAVAKAGATVLLHYAKSREAAESLRNDIGPSQMEGAYAMQVAFFRRKRSP